MAQAQEHSPLPEEGGEAQYEPQLKYNKLGGDVPNILETQQVSCLCLSDKILALGTDDGRVHVLDYEGNEVCFCFFGWLHAAVKHSSPNPSMCCSAFVGDVPAPPPVPHQRAQL
jgi:hypothetical protein